jgi:hypothetical protein
MAIASSLSSTRGATEPADIEKVRALFIDGDYLPRPDTWEWHVEPDFITHRGPHNWHAYWLVDDLPPEKFENAQRRLIEHYRSDKAVHDLPRVMRLAGTLHLKDPLHTRRASLFETAKSNSLVPLGKVFFEKLWRPEAQFRFARDSPLDGDGFEPSVPRIGPTVVDITPPIAQTCFQCCRGRPGFEKSSIMAPHPAPCARSLLRPGAPPVVLILVDLPTASPARCRPL